MSVHLHASQDFTEMGSQCHANKKIPTSHRSSIKQRGCSENRCGTELKISNTKSNSRINLWKNLPRHILMNYKRCTKRAFTFITFTCIMLGSRSCGASGSTAARYNLRRSLLLQSQRLFYRTQNIRLRVHGEIFQTGRRSRPFRTSALFYVYSRWQSPRNICFFLANNSLFLCMFN